MRMRINTWLLNTKAENSICDQVKQDFEKLRGWNSSLLRVDKTFGILAFHTENCQWKHNIKMNIILLNLILPLMENKVYEKQRKIISYKLKLKKKNNNMCKR